MNILVKPKKLYTPPVALRGTIVKRNLLRYFAPGRTVTQAKVYFDVLPHRDAEQGNPRLEARFNRIFSNLVRKGYLTENKDRYYTVKGEYANRRATADSDPQVGADSD